MKHGQNFWSRAEEIDGCRDRKITAYHEAGHAIVQAVVDDGTLRLQSNNCSSWLKFRLNYVYAEEEF